MKRQHRRSPDRKDKELTEVQHLKEENKNLRSENRNLKKRVKQLERQEHYREDAKLDVEADQMTFDMDEVIPNCPSCGKSGIREYNIVGRHWFECEYCEYDSRHENIKNKR
jgi:hypothetical protein